MARTTSSAFGCWMIFRHWPLLSVQSPAWARLGRIPKTTRPPVTKPKPSPPRVLDHAGTTLQSQIWRDGDDVRHHGYRPGTFTHGPDRAGACQGFRRGTRPYYACRKAGLRHGYRGPDRSWPFRPWRHHPPRPRKTARRPPSRPGDVRAGKSWTLRRILEQTHGLVQQIVIDPEGEFVSLAQHYDYPILDGSRLDTAALAIAAARAREHRLSVLLDLSQIGKPRCRPSLPLSAR